VSEGSRRRATAIVLLSATLALPPARGSAAPASLAGVDLTPESGPAAYRGGTAVVLVGERVEVRLVVLDPEGRPVRRLEAWDAGAHATAWVWEGREARPAATGLWAVRLERPGHAWRALLARPVRARGQAPRVSFTVRADAGR
jgi:hypothetical protein